MEQIIIAGFGGQGVLSMGMLLAYSGMLEDKNVTWLPSYGPEMRGGTANCNVIVSEEEIGAPTVTQASTIICMNRPSLDKFEKNVQEGGLLLVNSSLVDIKATREDIEVVYVPANELAAQLNNEKVANMVMLGAFLELTKLVNPESVLDSLLKVLGESKAKLVPLNREALQKGAQIVRA
ncbi:MAG: 2-oxoacid:acceptor oxidoreductase family protein [Christensenellales bacterium]|jgi:2-oxoglutarate ferredoxin oxidoreductase subunit gamma